MTSERRVGARAEQKRRWDREHRPPCVDCGAPRARAAERCALCAAVHAGRRHPEIARLWGQGWTYRQIAAQVGMLPASMAATMARMRAAGWDLPLRHDWSPDGLERARNARRKVAA